MFSHGKSKRGKNFHSTKSRNKSNAPAKRKFGNDKKRSNHKRPKYEEPSIKPMEKALVKEVVESSESEEESDIHKLAGSFGIVVHEGVESDDDSSISEEVEEIEASTEDIDNSEVSSEESEVSNDDMDELEVATTVEISKGDLIDRFENHFLLDLSEPMVTTLQSLPIKYNKTYENWPSLGKLVVELPVFETIKQTVTQGISIEKDKPTAISAISPQRQSNKQIKTQIKTQILGNITKANVSYKCSDDSVMSELQKEIFSIINNYQDLYFTGRTFVNAELLRFTYCLHAANHIIKTRNKVIHHNARLTNKDDVPEQFRDQGLVRPKILIVLPFRDSAYKVINMLIDLILPSSDKGSVINQSRFVDDFTGHEIQMPKKNPKPEDYEQIFHGNTNDDFKIGITITKKSVKLYANFYSSDVILASPLGLRQTIGAAGEPDRDFDFLNSIEVLILDQCELYLMQNFDHVLHLLDHLHLQPKDTHGTDLSRVRTWTLNGLGKYYRQTLVFSGMQMAEFNGIVSRKCMNYHGRVRVVKQIHTGSISQVFNPLPHVFHKFETNSFINTADDRFNFFINKILPPHKDSLMKQTLVFISSYFDYVRVRNYFKREDISFVQICEYSKEGKIARARDMFFHGDAHFLLYTERYHFYNRIRLKGIRHVIFYQPPIFHHFYNEICNLMQEGNMNRKVGDSSNMTVTILYCKFDVLQMASLVGTERANSMVESDRNVHMLLTDGT